MSVLFEQAVAPAAGSAAQRSAALLLHGMNEADRAWAWDRLDDLQREALAPLLQELSDLGVPRDAGLLRDVVASTAVAAMPDATARQRVAAAEPARVANVLALEPAGLVRRLLALGPWPWQDAVLATLRARRGEIFEPDCAAGPPAPALDEALLDRLAERVGVTALEERAPSAWWHRLWQQMRRNGAAR